MYIKSVNCPPYLVYSTILSHHREFNGKQNITTMIRSWHERNFSIIGALFAETISHVSLLRTELAMQNCVTGNVTLNRTLVRTPEFDTMTTYDVILMPQLYCGIRFLPKWCNTHHEIWHEITHQLSYPNGNSCWHSIKTRIAEEGGCFRNTTAYESNIHHYLVISTLIASLMGPTWGLPGGDDHAHPKMSWMTSSWFPYDWKCAVGDIIGLHQHNSMILNKTQTFNNRKQWHQY